MHRAFRTTAVAATLVAAAAGSLAAQAEIRLTGAGATFPYPIYSKWVLEYTTVRPHIQINYASIGSGGGIRQFTDHTVDFGASDSAGRSRLRPKAVAVSILPLTARSVRSGSNRSAMF